MNLCFHIARYLYKRKLAKQKKESSRGSSDEAYWRWQMETSTAYFRKFPSLYGEIEGKSVIDIGCGLGGRTCFLAKKGVTKITGTDINHPEIEKARQLADKGLDPELRSRVEFKKVDEGKPQDNELYDVALLIDSMEHVKDPTQMLNVAYDHLKPGGICYFSTFGWYHHAASHVRSIVPVPFATVFFSDRAILNAVKRMLEEPFYQPSMWDSDPPIKRWENVRSLQDRPGEHLNKYSISKFRKAMKASKFLEHMLHVEPFDSSKRPMLKVINWLSKVPIIREVYHSAIFGVLRKAPKC
ncbi:MAG: class I SAM-dependent methyltransferase [Opitutales bacterium]|nr:class I SAM-dependent methyltransferase [Opitutales bacterium]